MLAGNGMRRGEVGEGWERPRRARCLGLPGEGRPARARQMREAFLSIDRVHAPRQPNDFERPPVKTPKTTWETSSSQGGMERRY